MADADAALDVVPASADTASAASDVAASDVAASGGTTAGHPTVRMNPRSSANADDRRSPAAGDADAGAGDDAGDDAAENADVGFAAGAAEAEESADDGLRAMSSSLPTSLLLLGLVHSTSACTQHNTNHTCIYTNN